MSTTSTPKSNTLPRQSTSEHTALVGTMPDNPAFKRLFVAIELPDEIRSHLISLETAIPGVRWTKERQLHLTLSFIGNVSVEKIHDLTAALEAISVPAFALHMHGLGLFAKTRQSILWAGVETSPALQSLKYLVDKAIEQSLELPPEKADYTPHITLARIQQEIPPLIDDLIKTRSQKVDAPFDVKHFALFSSTRTAQGALYRQEARFAFSDAFFR